MNNIHYIGILYCFVESVKPSTLKTQHFDVAKTNTA